MPRGADDLVAAVSAKLTDRLPPIHTYMGYGITPPEIVSLTAFEAAKFNRVPLAVVSSPGLISASRRHAVWSGTWAVVITVVDRPERSNHTETMQLLQRHATAVRTAVLTDRTLAGFSTDARLVAEEYDRIDARVSQTLGACFVQFEIDVPDIITVSDYDLAVPATGTVTSTHVSTTVRS